MPNSSFSTFATGARQFVVHDAFENTSYDEVSKVAQLTPRTRVCTLPPLEGPVNSTFLAPALMCACALSPWLKAPVASITTSMPRSAHEIGRASCRAREEILGSAAFV